MATQVQVTLFTKQAEYAVPDSPFSLAGSVTGVELNSLIKSLLKDSGTDVENVEFDFLAVGEILRLSLKEHLENRSISLESSVDVEYFVKYPAPSPENSLIHDDWVSAVKAAGNWILSGCYDDTLHLWSADGDHKLTIPGHIAPVKAVAWIEIGDPVSSFVSTSHDETAMLWKWNQDTNSVDCVHVCKGHSRSVDCVDVYQAHQKFVTGSYDQMLKIWSTDMEEVCEDGIDDTDGSRKRQKTDNGKSKIKTPMMTISGHTDGISGIQWTEANEVCTCSMDSTLRVWDVELGGIKTQLNGSKAFFDVSYSYLSRALVTASADRHIRLWDPRSKEGSLVKSVFTSHNSWVFRVKWSPCDEFQFISGSYDTLVKLWDTRSPKAPLYDLSGHEDKVLSIDWSTENLIVSGGADNHVKIFKAQNHSETLPME